MRRTLMIAAVLGGVPLLAGCGNDTAGGVEAGENPDFLVIHASEPRFTSLEEIVDVSSAVVYGVVTSIDSHRYPGVDRSVAAQAVEDGAPRESFDASEVVTVRVEVIEVIAGELDTTDVSFPWQAFEILDEDLTRGRPTLQNGLLTPEIGGSYILFVREITPDDNEGDGLAPPSHSLVSFDGLIQVVDGKLFTTIEGGGVRISEKLEGKTVEQLRRDIAGLD